MINLLWFLFRTGTKPSRIMYPCQRAALVNGLTLLKVSVFFSLAGFLATTKKFIPKKGTTLVLLAILATAVINSEQLRGNLGPVEAVNSNQEIELELESRNATAFPVSDIYVVNGRVSAHVSELINLMGSHGLLFYKSNMTGVNQGPDGLIAQNDVVLIKINEQWDQRGGTNTDVLKELILAILDHPDGFVGEIVIADNGQGWGHLDWPKSNAENHSQSTQDVVDMFSPYYKVSTYDWQPIRHVRVQEYSEGDMTDGYVLYDTADPETGIYVSYPKFETEFGTYLSFKHGVWNGTGYEERLKIINVPVLKSHFVYGVTACLKNYMGVQSERYFGGLGNGHTSVGTGGMGTLMVETGLPTLNIIDAIWINANPWPSAYTGPSTPYSIATRVNVLMASTDPVALDYWAAKHVLVQAAGLIGYDDTHTLDPDNIDRDGLAEAFGVWLNLSKNELVAGGYDVTTDENRMNIYVREGLDTAPPTISILSPEFKAYPEGDVLLSFIVNEPTDWMGYSLDGQANVTISGNTVLTGLSEDVHNVIVFANDTCGNMGTSHRVYFCTLIRDLAVINVTMEDWAYQGWTLKIEVTVMNKGNVSETFAVEAYCDTNLIENITVENLPVKNVTTKIIWWNTQNAAPCTNHTISVAIPPVSCEFNVEDNQYAYGTVKIRIVGDVNDDNAVDINDVALAAIAFGSTPRHLRWNDNADLDRNGKVDIFDVVMVAANFGAS